MLLIINSCNNNNEETKIARVNDRYLLKNDLINEIPINISSEDSIIFVKNYIHNWLVDHLILNKANEMIPSEVINVEKKMDKYKMSLISYEFEQFYINKRLDTNINTFEIVDYYNNHLDDFVLNDYVVKCLYIKVPEKSKHLRELKRKYFTSNEKMMDEIISLVQKESISHYYNPEEWVYFDDLIKQIPSLEKYDKVNLIKKKKKVVLEVKNDIYLVNIYDYLIKDGTSPLSFEKEKIKSILLNQRANSLRKKLRQDLYEDGIKKNLIEKI
tara:strand:- start:80 stop:892 length:813 start_codon:yes stop_codon:yes gene_type:complete